MPKLHETLPQFTYHLVEVKTGIIKDTLFINTASIDFIHNLIDPDDPTALFIKETDCVYMPSPYNSDVKVVSKTTIKWAVHILSLPFWQPLKSACYSSHNRQPIWLDTNAFCRRARRSLVACHSSTTLTWTQISTGNNIRSLRREGHTSNPFPLCGRGARFGIDLLN